MTRAVSCGVLVTDGRGLLLGHATRTPRWDIPKGLAELGEPEVAAARRELREETGLHVPPGSLTSLGLHRYLPDKDLALFAWVLPNLPDPASLRCTSMVGTGSAAFPEFDRFQTPAWADALTIVGKSLRAVLTPILATQSWWPPPG